MSLKEVKLTRSCKKMPNYPFIPMMGAKLFNYLSYAAKWIDSSADLGNPSNVLYIYENPHGLKRAISEQNNISLRGNKTYFINS